MKGKNQHDGASVLIIISLIVLDLFLWHDIFSYGLPSPFVRTYVIPVGHGSAELILFPGNIKMLIDAGSDQTILAALEKIIPSGDTYIDLVVMSDAEPNRFGGYQYIFDHYRIGAFIYNGRADDQDAKEWSQLLQKIKEKNIPLVTLGMGDTIHYGNEAEIDILSPSKDFDHSASPADTAPIELIKNPEYKMLLTADAGANVKDFLVAQGDDLRADILISSGTAFLAASEPRLALTHAPSGTLEAYVEKGKLEVFKQP